MEWQPIETAPVDERIQYGWWEVYNDERIWRARSGVVWRRRKLIGGVVRSDYWDADKATHWMPLPEPPK